MKPITEQIIIWRIAAGLAVLSAMMVDSRILAFIAGISFVCSISLAHTAKKMRWLRRREQFYSVDKYRKGKK
jgi:hypothetical protein